MAASPPTDPLTLLWLCSNLAAFTVGAIATDFSGGVVHDNPEVNKAVAAHTALGRIGGPEDVGPVIADLLPDEFGWVNAQ